MNAGPVLGPGFPGRFWVDCGRQAKSAKVPSKIGRFSVLCFVNLRGRSLIGDPIVIS